MFSTPIHGQSISPTPTDTATANSASATVVSRWLVMPSAAMSSAVAEAADSASSRTSCERAQISLGSCSTHPALGKICSCSFWATLTTLPLWSKIIALRARRALVQCRRVLRHDPSPCIAMNLRRPRTRCAAAGTSTSRPDPGGRCCAGRGSWRGPCGPPAGSSPSCPSSAASAERLVASPRRRRRPARRRSASTAGSSASTIVLSPGSALPRACTPLTPASSASVQPATSSSDLPAAAVPICRNSVPYSGPGGAADARDQRHADGLQRSRRCRRPRAPRASRAPCCMPRSMFVPWSPSPIAVSSAHELGAVLADHRGVAPDPVQVADAGRGRCSSVTRPTAAPACRPARPTAASARRRARAA